MESTKQKRFPPPWQVQTVSHDRLNVVDANGIVLAVIFCREDLQRWSFGHGLAYREASGEKTEDLPDFAGFFDLAVAAPSMKAALEAWGADSNLFHQGAA